jgi:hypothetical protein
MTGSHRQMSELVGMIRWIMAMHMAWQLLLGGAVVMVMPVLCEFLRKSDVTYILCNGQIDRVMHRGRWQGNQHQGGRHSDRAELF